MNRTELLYLLPYLGSLALTTAILIYAWRHRQVRGGPAYVWLVLGQTLSILGFILELITPELPVKITWDKIQWLTDTIIVVAVPIFAARYTDYKPRHPRLLTGLLFAIPAWFNVLVLTDPITHSIYVDPHLSNTYPFPDLEYQFTLFVDIYAVYVYAVSLAGVGLLIGSLFRSHDYFNPQTIIISVGLLIPVLSSSLAIFNIQLTPQRDLSPFSFAIGNLVIAWGLFRYRLFDIVPVARDTVIENMGNPVVVLDLQNRVVDLNPAAIRTFGKSRTEIIGRSADKAFTEWESLVKMFTGELDIRSDIAVDFDDVTRHYELHISPLRDRRSRIIGRVFVAAEITDRIQLQTGLQDLNEKLEQRVRERTEALAEAYDTTLEGWARALELRDKETEGHSRRVTELTLKLARALQISGEELDNIRRGALLHDIGKMGVPDEILRKPGKLTDEERGIIQQHPVWAYELLTPISFLKTAMEIPLSHHEKWDGSGYPRGLKGAEIPLSARIFAIADVWDAVQSNRPYNQAWPRQKAVEYIREQSGKHFDPAVVEVFLELEKRDRI